ncbi:MAG: translation initiation factor IF-2 [Spirochaetaceae bacterium]|nr:translation initiation factor IF-2 [Spirochaetaceae bacterium]
MAEETEKKQKYVLHKPKNDSVPAKPANEPEKKKVVVVKKKTSQGGNKPGEKGDAPKVTVKKAESQPTKDSSKAVSQTDAKNEKPRSEKAEGEKPVKTEKTTFELSPSRPNVKMGNLAEKGRGQNRYGENRGGENRYGNKNRDGNGGNFNRNNRNGEGRQGGFTGAQAREGYQNRNGENRQGGFNKDKNGQGGNFRRDRNGQGGNGQGQNRGNGQGRPGFGNKQGGQGQRPQGGFGGNRPGFGGRSGFGAAPAPMEEAKKVPAKKTFTKKKTVYSRKDREEELEDKLFIQKKKQQAKLDAVPEKIEIMETVSVSDLAKKMNLKAADIIGKLMSMGMMVSITQSIDADTATLLASEYNCDVHVVNLYDETVIASEEDTDEAMESRPPVVTVMGHVDHGKTKTLDAIRSANVVASEFGGITQHIGAYMVDTPKGKITFLDTPGHEAFTMMRARGAAITDIVILVVAADDGVMPQTVEAINHAKDAKVPIVVAVNKVDKPEANPDKVMTQLSEYGLTPEEWGGDTQYVKISALKKEGIDELLEAVLLQAEILELKANGQCRAEGKIIESRIDHGRGVVSTIIVQRGKLRTGDPYVAGIYSGRVRAIFNDRGQKITEATPSMPVEILGLEAMPNAGDPFQVTETEKEARAISSKRQELKRFEDAKAVKKVTLDNLYATIDDGEIMELKVIIKADVQGSAEALKQSLEKLSTKDIRLVVIHSSAGAINESDVVLAAADSNAIIIGFNVRPTPKAKVLAEQEKVDIRKYNIIYKCVEEITAAMEGMLKPDVKEEVIGTVEVRDTFKVPKVGTIAGAYVLDGMVKRTSTVNVIRDGIVVHNGKIASLKRFKDDAKEVSTGYECGIGLENFNDVRVGDQFEVIEFVEVARKLGESLAEQKAREAKEAGEGAN